MPHNGLVLAKESSCESFSKKKEEKRVKIKKSKTQHGIDPREYRKNFYNINFTREIWMPTNVTVSNNNENKASLLMLVQKAIISHRSSRTFYSMRRKFVSHPFGKFGSFESGRGKYTRTSF